jgi:hypothetical protein
MNKEEREDQVGSRPEDREGYQLYARLNHSRFGSHYVWVYRRRRGKRWTCMNGYKLHSQAWIKKPKV